LGVINGAATYSTTEHLGVIVGQKISPNAAAEELGISLRQVRRLISSGELRAYRVGKCSIIRIDTDDLAALLKPVVSEAVRVDPVSDRVSDDTSNCTRGPVCFVLVR
jgi:excisionase family DNA binding protein